jgi:hypothetical protein
MLCDLIYLQKHVAHSEIQRIFVNIRLSWTEHFRMGDVICQYAATVMFAVL